MRRNSVTRRPGAVAETDQRWVSAPEICITARAQYYTGSRSEVRLESPLTGDQLSAAHLAQRFAPPAHALADHSDLRPPTSSQRGMLWMWTAQGVLLAFGSAVSVGAALWLREAHLAATHDQSVVIAIEPPAIPTPDVLPQAKSQPRQVLPVLTSPERLEVAAGEEVSLDIALDGTDGVPFRSIIAISGIPKGATLSTGRSDSETEWSLKPDEIGDLRLVTPKTTSGEAKLKIQLVASDGEVVADSQTLLEVKARPAVAVASLPLSSERKAAAVATQPVAPHSKEIRAKTAAAEPSYVGKANDSHLDGGPAATGSAPLSSGRAGDLVVPTMFVNLRQGPLSSASIVGVVAKGAKLRVIDRKSGWVQVIDPATSKKGWIYEGLTSLGNARRKREVSPSDSGSFWKHLSHGFSSP